MGLLKELASMYELWEMRRYLSGESHGPLRKKHIRSRSGVRTGKDQDFFGQPEGRHPLWGRALCQPEFAAQTANSEKDGIHVALDTRLYAPWDHLRQVLAHVDLVLADMKILRAGGIRKRQDSQARGSLKISNSGGISQRPQRTGDYHTDAADSRLHDGRRKHSGY